MCSVCLRLCMKRLCLLFWIVWCPRRVMTLLHFLTATEPPERPRLFLICWPAREMRAGAFGAPWMTTFLFSTGSTVTRARSCNAIDPGSGDQRTWNVTTACDRHRDAGAAMTRSCCRGGLLPSSRVLRRFYHETAPLATGGHERRAGLGHRDPSLSRPGGVCRHPARLSSNRAVTASSLAVPTCRARHPRGADVTPASNEP